LAEPGGPWVRASGAEIEAGQVDVWLFEPSSADARAAVGLLSEEERARSARFRSPAQRIRFEAARGTLREILSGYLGVDPLEVPIVYGPQGKPQLSPEIESPLAFNLSHSGEMAAVAVTSGAEIGVDVEMQVDRERLPALTQAVLAPSERPWFDGLRASERVRAFFDLWSAKEACAKLIGRGLTMPFSTIALASPGSLLTPVAVSHSSAPEAPCLVRRLPVDHGYSGALAVESCAEAACEPVPAALEYAA
jgi:4'-phosphopantetheinyl transferase